MQITRAAGLLVAVASSITTRSGRSRFASPRFHRRQPALVKNHPTRAPIRRWAVPRERTAAATSPTIRT